MQDGGLPLYMCWNCFHEWTPRVAHPKECPNCKLPAWFIEPKRRPPDVAAWMRGKVAEYRAAREGGAILPKLMVWMRSQLQERKA